VVAALDPLRQLDLLRGGEELDPADVLEEKLERIGRDLARRLNRLLFLLDGDDLERWRVRCTALRLPAGRGLPGRI
jgi:hypothetical protein